MIWFWYSRLATDNGLYIRALNRCRTSLEDYYMNLKNGGIRGC
jgi:ABC-2 type transport system ATP-binding protein